MYEEQEQEQEQTERLLEELDEYMRIKDEEELGKQQVCEKFYSPEYLEYK